jgi:hypothetical protein
MAHLAPDSHSRFHKFLKRAGMKKLQLVVAFAHGNYGEQWITSGDNNVKSDAYCPIFGFQKSISLSTKSVDPICE